MTRAVRAVYLLFLFWVPIETIDLFQPQGDSRVLSASRLTGLFLFLLALVDWPRSLRKIPAELWAVGWYVAFYSASQLWLPRGLDLMFWKKQLVLIYSVLLFVVSANLLSDSEFRAKCFRFFGWWVAIVSAAMILGVFGPPSEALEGRGTILGQDPNVAAAFFASAAICVAGDPRTFALNRSLARAALAPAAVCALILGVLQTGSRGGLLALGAGILGLAVCGGARTRKQRAFIAAALLAVLALFVRREFRLGTNTANRLTESWTEGDTAGRDAIFAEAWSMFRDRPLLGYGGARNNYILGQRLDFSVDGVFERDTHNLALDVLTEVGLVGSLPLLCAILFCLWKAWLHGRRSGDALPFALMCAQVTINMSLTGLNQNLFWIVLAAASAA